MEIFWAKKYYLFLKSLQIICLTFCSLLYFSLSLVISLSLCLQSSPKLRHWTNWVKKECVSIFKTWILQMIMSMVQMTWVNWKGVVKGVISCMDQPRNWNSILQPFTNVKHSSVSSATNCFCKNSTFWHTLTVFIQT